MLGHFAFFIVALVAVKGEEECKDVQDIQRCFQTRAEVPFVNIPDLPDEEFLKENCGPSIRLLECATDGLQKCPEVVGEHINDKMDSLQFGLNYLHSVCDEDSELKQRYLENIGCYSNMNPQVEECKNVTHAIVDDFFHEEETSRGEGDYFHYGCIFVPQFHRCVVEEVTQVCGAENTSPLDDILTQLSTANVIFTCRDEIQVATWQERFSRYLEERAPGLDK